MMKRYDPKRVAPAVAERIITDPRLPVLIVQLIDAEIMRHEFLERLEAIIGGQLATVRSMRMSWCRCPDEFLECTGKCRPDFQDEHEIGVPA